MPESRGFLNKIGRGFKPGDFPIAERVGRNILTLPLFAEMRDEDVPRVAEALMQVLRAAARH